MDSRERIEMTCEQMQSKLEHRIGTNPDDVQAIDRLWRVQSLRYENVMRMRYKGRVPKGATAKCDH